MLLFYFLIYQKILILGHIFKQINIFIKKDIFKNIISSFKSEGSYNIILGLSIGILYFILYTLFSTFQYGFPTLNSAHFSFIQIILQLAIALSTGFIEELLFRRYILEESLHIFNDSIVANSFTTILFTLIHLPIIFFVYKYSFASSVSYLLLLTISGFIYGAVYLHKKSLIASTLTHAVWNFLGTIIR